ncbi:hypothetical protein C2845_PM01G09860 [Panicum miliaceum]|uniref:Uncharacterized protein n=1 Tax=Panicum miliaceum TaxID=4540 RepID=A0A3L6TJ97_PANMI|nr:hypothetical protein C2845_PM01G09860 [Panicum miliaceum]
MDQGWLLLCSLPKLPAMAAARSSSGGLRIAPGRGAATGAGEAVGERRSGSHRVRSRLLPAARSCPPWPSYGAPPAAGGGPCPGARARTAVSVARPCAAGASPPRHSNLHERGRESEPARERDKERLVWMRTGGERCTGDVWIRKWWKGVVWVPRPIVRTARY